MQPKKISFGNITSLQTNLRFSGRLATGLIDHSAPIARGSSGSPLADQKTTTCFAVNVAVTENKSSGAITNHHALPIQQIVEVAQNQATSEPWLKATRLWKPKKLTQDDSTMPLYGNPGTYVNYNYNSTSGPCCS